MGRAQRVTMLNEVFYLWHKGAIDNLRAILCKKQANCEMNNFDLSSNSVRNYLLLGGCLKMHFVRVATLLFSW